MKKKLNRNQVKSKTVPETMFDIDNEHNISTAAPCRKVKAARRPGPPARPVAPGPGPIFPPAFPVPGPEPIPPGMRPSVRPPARPPVRPIPPGPEPIPPGMRPPVRPPARPPVRPPAKPPARPPVVRPPVCPPAPGVFCPPGMPPNRIYVVRRGDTLRGIARMFGVSVRNLMFVNNLRRPTIRVGQRLVIPPIPIVPL